MSEEETVDVVLNCPQCEVPISATVEVHTFNYPRQGAKLFLRPCFPTHACYNNSMSEPQTALARVTVSREDGSVEYWIKAHDGWISDEERKAQAWDYVLSRGSVLKVD